MDKSCVLDQFKVSDVEFIQLCKKFKVRTVYVFGSVLGPEFKMGKSDLDFLVDFHHLSYDVFFDFLESLKEMFDYKNVDLITTGALKNKIIREEIMSSRKLLYAS